MSQEVKGVGGGGVPNPTICTHNALFTANQIDPPSQWPNGGDKKKRKKKSGFYESTHYNIVYALCRLLNRIFSVITESSFSGLFVK